VKEKKGQKLKYFFIILCIAIVIMLVYFIMELYAGIDIHPHITHIPDRSSVQASVKVSPESTNNWPTYTNTAFGYSINYPPDVSIRPNLPTASSVYVGDAQKKVYIFIGGRYYPAPKEEWESDANQKTVDGHNVRITTIDNHNAKIIEPSWPK
jgi:hypothetical protein